MVHDYHCDFASRDPYFYIIYFSPQKYNFWKKKISSTIVQHTNALTMSTLNSYSIQRKYISVDTTEWVVGNKVYLTYRRLDLNKFHFLGVYSRKDIGKRHGGDIFIPLIVDSSHYITTIYIANPHIFPPYATNNRDEFLECIHDMRLGKDFNESEFRYELDEKEDPPLIATQLRAKNNL